METKLGNEDEGFRYVEYKSRKSKKKKQVVEDLATQKIKFIQNKFSQFR